MAQGFMLRRFLRLVQARNGQLGFTLIDVLVVIMAIGIVTTLASSSWLGLLGRWEVNSVQQETYLGIRHAQVSAQRNKTDWQFSIHETPGGYVEWSSHPQKASPTVWNSVGTKDIDIDLADTTLDSSSGDYYVRFDYRGNLSSRTRTLTFNNVRVPKVKRCLVMSTLLGKIRLAREQHKPSSSGRYCY